MWILDFEQFAPRLVHIRDKAGRLVKLRPTTIQARMMATLKAERNIVVLKGRQTKVTTIVLAHAFHRAMTIDGQRAVTVAQDDFTTKMVFDRVRNVMHKELPPELKPKLKRDNERVIVMPEIGDSTYYSRTAGGRGGGRADTLHYLHCTEYAFWKDYGFYTGASQALAPNAYTVIESTPNGFNEFYHLITRIQSGEMRHFKFLFFPWFLEGEYRVAGEAVPVAEWTEEERVVAAKAAGYGVTLDGAQVAWRRRKQEELRLQDAGDKFAQEYPEDVQSCFLASGRPRFDVAHLNGLLPAVQAMRPIEERYVDGLNLKYRAWAKFEAGKHYLIPADSSEGTSAGDYCNAQVIEWESGRKVADLWGKADPDLFGVELVKLAQKWGNAQLGPEGNNTGYAVINKVKGLGYSNVYRMRDGDGRPTDKWGWWTDSSTRPVLVSDLATFYRTATAAQVADAQEIGEAMSFVISARGKAEADRGAHDDKVMTRGIGMQMRKVFRPRGEAGSVDLRIGRQV